MLCNAKNKDGSLCTELGAGRNNRCYKHGGASTGPISELGKLISSRNAFKRFPNWFYLNIVDDSYISRADKAFIDLDILMDSDIIQWHKVFDIVDKNQIPLETMKYFLFEKYGSDALLIIQTALDKYYQEMDYQHFKFHVYQPQFQLDDYYQVITRPQSHFLDNWMKTHDTW
ncbi:HGGxSTG domain-containing protein [Photobacterium leiognathi]|uniref:HGGxSTG domain-containing protein n=1 Tax=Photobacterium leiognathi TaxID=553611 RepID=UPI0029825AD4|nr:HGGxSTG domain-containing protein [Photobacterium leiognathi]